MMWHPNLFYEYWLSGLKRVARNCRTATRRSRSGWSPPPILVVLRPTMQCNLACRICYDRGENVARSLWAEEDGVTRQELTTQQWCELIEALAGFGPSFYITGGEPLLSESLVPMIQAIKKRGLYVSLNTNGVLLEDRAAELVESGIDRIIVSLDGPRDTHNRIRGESFDRLAKGVRLIRQLKQDKGASRPLIRAQCVISKFNIDQMEETVEEAERIGCREIRFQHPMFVFEREECEVGEFLQCLSTRVDLSRPLRQADDLDGSLVRTMVGRLVAGSLSRIKVGFEPALSDEDVEGYYDAPDHSFPDLCLSPWRRMDISPRGEMGPCQGVYLGRYPGTSPDTCWNGATFRAVRRHMLKNGLFRHCNRCCHREYRKPNVFSLAVS